MSNAVFAYNSGLYESLKSFCAMGGRTVGNRFLFTPSCFNFLECLTKKSSAVAPSAEGHQGDRRGFIWSVMTLGNGTDILRT